MPISELQKYGDQLLKVGYMTQELRKPPLFRHARSSSFDQSRLEVDRVCDLTQRMSLDEQQYSSSQQQQQQQQKYYYSNNQKRYSSTPNGQPVVRRMTSTNSLKDNRHSNSNTFNGYSHYEQPRHSRSSANLYQGFWKPNSPVQQQPQPQPQPVSSSGEEMTTSTSTSSSHSRRLSLTSIHAPPFIPSSELQQQIQQQQQAQQQQQQAQAQQQQVQQHYPQQIQNGGGVYYYPPVGIPTPPPSASPVHHQQQLSYMYL